MSSPKDYKRPGLVEYALVIILVAAVVLLVLILLGPSIGNVYSGFGNEIFVPSSPLIFGRFSEL